jgi:excisionase family DNA binding protein
VFVRATPRQAVARPTGRELLTIAEVAVVLNCSRVTVWRRVHSGELPSIAVGAGQGRGRMLRVARDDLITFLVEANRP